MSLKGVKGRMPAYYSTVQDIDTTKQPQGCGGQQCWNVRGNLLGGWAVRSSFMYDRAAAAGGANPRERALTSSRTFRRRHCGAADKAPTMRRCMSSPSLSRRDVATVSLTCDG